MRASPTPGFRWVFSGAEEIRQFLPHIDDETFAKLHIPPYTAEQFHGDLQRVTRGRIDKTCPMCSSVNPPRRSIGCARSA